MSLFSRNIIFLLMGLIFFASCEQKSDISEYSEDQQEWIRKTEKIVLAVDDGYPPLNYRKSGKLVGLNIDLLQLIESKIGVPIELDGSNWDIALAKAMNHEVDGIVNATPLEERKKSLNFTTEFFADPKAMICLKEARASLRSRNDYKGLKVAAKKSSTQYKNIAAFLGTNNVVEIATLEEGITLLLLNEVSGVFDDYAPLYHMVNYHNLINIDIAFIEYPEEGSTIGLRNNEPLMLSVFNKAIELITEAENKEIQNKWIGLNQMYDLTKVYIAITLLVGLLLSVIIWTASLRILVKKRTVQLNSELELKQKIQLELLDYKDRLEEQVTERTMSLEMANDELLQINEKLQITNEELHLNQQKLEEALGKLREAQDKLVQSEKMASLGIMAAGIAHEINNPLHYIQGAIDGIEASITDDSVSKEDIPMLLEAMQTGVKRASDIVSSLNHFSSKSKLNEICNLHTILENCIILLYSDRKHGVEIIREYEPSLPIIIGNEGKLHQAFFSIIQNASQAITKLGKIWIRTEVVGTDVVVTITDNGMGIPEAIRSKITDPFFSTKAPGEGTGLGLSITYSIIEEHLGNLHFKSKVNHGTSVQVTLPKTNPNE